MPVSKRINFDVTPEQEAELDAVREALGASTTRDTVLRAVRVLSVLANETSRGGRIYVHLPDGEVERLVLPEIEPATGWRWLVWRPHPWRRQPHVKGRRLLASTIWGDMVANGQTLEEAAGDWELPTEAVEECVAWCEANRQLLEAEAAEEERLLAGMSPVAPPR